MTHTALYALMILMGLTPFQPAILFASFSLPTAFGRGEAAPRPLGQSNPVPWMIVYIP